MKTQTVTIPAGPMHEGYYRLTVTLPWTCPTCGGPRGEPFDGHSYDGSRSLRVSCWINPCGHVDYYSDVRNEWAEIQQRGLKVSEA